jgi:hypothetical protein
LNDACSPSLITVCNDLIEGAESSAEASKDSAKASIVSAMAAWESVKVANDLLKIEQDREVAVTLRKLAAVGTVRGVLGIRIMCS